MFRGLSTAPASTVLVIIVAIGVFLVDKAIPALRADHANFLTYKNWFPSDNRRRCSASAPWPSVPC